MEIQSHFDRSALPPPRTFYEREFGFSLGRERRGWVQKKCCFHDGKSKTSLGLNLREGNFYCFSCGAKGGDVLAFVRLRYNLSFIQAAKELGAWHDQVTPQQSQELRRRHAERERERAEQLAKTESERQQRVFARDHLRAIETLYREAVAEHDWCSMRNCFRASGKPKNTIGAWLRSRYGMSSGPIRSFAEIPNIVTLAIPPAEYLAPALGIARNTITLRTGPDGDGKTYLAQAMALAVARGDDFLGMRCIPSPVLYLDLENPGYVVQERIQALLGGGDCPANLRFWGTWLDIDQQPPQAGSDRLLTMCKETRPLLIVDPFRYFHQAEENDSTAMSGVMQYLRACAVHGAAVVILHHPAKTEGSTGRGSSAIRGAFDLAFLHTLDRESGLITLKVDKNRLGASRTITVKADFEEGKFELGDAPYVTRRNDELDRLEQVIKDNPSISQNAICKQLGGRRNRIVHLLKEGINTRWRTENGKHGSILYQHLARPLFPKTGTADTGSENPTQPNLYRCSPPLGGNRIQVGDGPKIKMSSCPDCGSFAIYTGADGKGSCMTCEGSW